MSKSITAGVDFGNQTCVLSVPTKYGVDIVLNQSSNRKTPTIIGYQNERRFSGEFALQQQMMNINNTITNLKQLVGLPYNSNEREELSKIVPYQIICLEDNGLSGIQLENNTILRPEQMIAYLLKSLLEIIQMKNPKIEQLVLTIPPWYNELQRRTLLNAASISKIKIASLLDSTTAAAISYLKIHSDRLPDDSTTKSNIVFIDLGDTSLNVAVTSLSKKSIEIKGFEYDKTISGQFFTNQLQDFLLKKVQEKYKIDPKTNKRSILRFQQATEKVKKALSANSIIMFEIPSLMNDIDVSIPLKRDEFNELFENRIEKVNTTIKNALKKSNLSKEDISAVEVLGGGSRIPAVKNEIRSFFGFEPKMSLDLDECFAVGAGFMAAKSDGYDVGIERIESVLHFDVDAEFESQKNEGKKINVMKSGSKMVENLTFSVPVLNKNEVSLFCCNEKVGCIEIKTGLDEVVDVDVTVSFDTFGLINITKIAVKNQEKNVKNEKIKNKENEKEETNENDNRNKIEEEEKNKVHDHENELFDKDDKNSEQVKNFFNTSFSSSSFIYSPFIPLSSTNIEKFAKIEEEMDLKDKKEIEIDNTKNDLESFIFKTLSEMNEAKITNENEKAEIRLIKEKVDEIFAWFSDNEFERLDLDVYKSKVSEIKIQYELLNAHKKFHQKIDKLTFLRIKLDDVLDVVQKDKERSSLKESIDLISEIHLIMSKIDEIHSQKKVVCEFDILSIEKVVEEIDSKSESLKNIQLNKPEKEEEKDKNSPEKESLNKKSDRISLKGEMLHEKEPQNVKIDQISIKEKVEENENKAQFQYSSSSSSHEFHEETTEINLPKEDAQNIHTKTSSTITKDGYQTTTETQQKHEEQPTPSNVFKEATTLYHHHIDSSGKISNEQNKQREAPQPPPNQKQEDNDKFSPNSELKANDQISSEKTRDTISITEPPIDGKTSIPPPHRNRIRIKKDIKINNNNNLLKLDKIQTKNRPYSNNQKHRIKLPPLLSLEGEETDLLSENELKNFDSLNCNSPSNSPSPLHGQIEIESARRENASNLPPLAKNPFENKKKEAIDSIKSFKRPMIPNNQKNRAGQFLRFHTA